MTAHTKFNDPARIDVTRLLDAPFNAAPVVSSPPAQSGPPGSYDSFDPSTNSSEVTGVSSSASEVTTESAQISSPPVDLPFLNLDPYDMEGKGNLPEGHLVERPDGNLGSQVQSSSGAGEHQVEFALEMAEFRFQSDDGTLNITELTEERATEVKTMSFNGQEVPVEYQSGLAYGFEGSFIDTDLRKIDVNMHYEVAEGFQAEAFDAEGNPLLTSYGYEQVVAIEGQAFDYGIEEFAMELEFTIDLEMNDFGMYVMSVSVVFDGEITYLDGHTREYGFEYEMEVLFSSLDQVKFDQFPPGLFDEIARFASGMGDAWDALRSLNDHLEAVLLQLKEDGHYQAWDDVDQGLDNPFDFELPPVDPFA